MTERGRHRALPLLLTTLVACSGLLVSGSVVASAATTAGGRDGATQGVAETDADAVDCAPGGAEGLAARSLPGVDGVVRGPEPSAATVEAYERDLERQLATEPGARATPDARGDAPRRTKIRVYVHVLKPSAKAKGVSRAKIRRQIKVMNRAYAGKQWKKARSARFRFSVKKVDYTVNRSWYYATLGSKASREMRKELHRGKRRDLNLYIGGPTERGGLQLLGYATFPQRAKKKLAYDGVVIHKDSMPGGRFRGYNKGDTGVHEVGHWLGLYHTFHGGCSKRNDRVADTPAERVPSFECPKGRDTCPSPGEDPIHNFMDYSYDRCMHHFTPGQIDRMRKLWRVYRR
ncbi:zinc metalloprotease [Mumia zhuanghuii]|uniref:Zinc metalloprotease n=1 Tax=Mumia zhuanghuii TaxID=2585211 RepID=A0A5C4MF00_9ACTN|nr:zinc metalloprotease [Mumia zhuanghuii]TNC39863.1 zinc metalloprotease [Mumia zhuanghuii]TNC41776.1 zinc metalloprotease [Mumia zhuanghuii]